MISNQENNQSGKGIIAADGQSILNKPNQDEDLTCNFNKK